LTAQRPANCSASSRKSGVDPEQFAGRSLRAGFITSAHLAEKNEHSIMKQSRHKSIKVTRSHIREADIFLDNAASGMRFELLGNLEMAKQSSNCHIEIVSVMHYKKEQIRCKST
jgi:hypothetical protein